MHVVASVCGWTCMSYIHRQHLFVEVCAAMCINKYVSFHPYSHLSRTEARAQLQGRVPVKKKSRVKIELRQRNIYIFEKGRERWKCAWGGDMNLKEKAMCARKLTRKDSNNTTVACTLCKRWASACVIPSGIIQLKGHLSSCLLDLRGLHYFLLALGGTTFGVCVKIKGSWSGWYEYNL